MKRKISHFVDSLLSVVGVSLVSLSSLAAIPHHLWPFVVLDVLLLIFWIFMGYLNLRAAYGRGYLDGTIDVVDSVTRDMVADLKKKKASEARKTTKKEK